jgi:filamentous hemagglutinin
MGKTITGSTTIGVTLSVNPTTIAGSIATSGYAVYGPATKAWTLVNDGRIDSSNAVGVYLPGGGKVTNAKHDSIGGNDEAVFMVGKASISNAGTMAANGFAIRVAEYGGVARITNSAGGLITGGGGLEVTGTADILNQGVIDGKYYGIVASSGTIDNAKGATIIGDFAVDFTGAGTIIDAGLIESTGTGYFAIGMGSSAGNELLLQSGATLIGAIDEFTAGQTIDEAGLKITSKSFAGGVLTLFDGKSKIGTLDFGGNLNASAFNLKSDGHGGTDIELDTETFTGAYTAGVALAALTNVVASGARISEEYQAVFGSAYRDWTLTNQGALIGEVFGVRLLGGGFVSNAAHGLIEGGIGIKMSAGTLIDAGTIIGTGGTAISLATGTGNVDIILQSGAKLEGAIYGFDFGDTIDLAGVTATGETFHNGILTLTNGHAMVETIALDGLFNSSGFTLKSISGGTDIIAAPGETFTGHYGVELRLTSQFTSITAKASFGGTQYGVLGEGGKDWTLLNSGTVTGSDYGVSLASGQVTNAAGGLISGDSGVDLEGAGLTNAGSIIGANMYGVGFKQSNVGAVSRNLAGGGISGGGVGAGIYGGSFANAGTIFGADGVFLRAATLSNSGRITGGGSSYASERHAGLYVGDGHDVNNDVIITGFASNAASGIIDGPVGAEMYGGVLVNAGKIIGLPGPYPEPSRGLVMTGGVATNTATGTIAGSIGVELQGGTLIDAGTIDSTSASIGAAITFGAAPATLVLDKGNVIDGAIPGFKDGDVIEFAGTTITSETVVNYVITLFSGSAIIESLVVDGGFDTADFRLVSLATGTELTLASSNSSLSPMQFLRPAPSGEDSSLTIPTLPHPIADPTQPPSAAPLPTIMGWFLTHPTTPPPLLPTVTLGQ